MIEGLVIVACILFAYWFFWGLHCNSKTYNERMRILAHIRYKTNGEDFWKAHQEFDLVLYDDHFKALFWYKDATKLYGPKIQEIMK